MDKVYFNKDYYGCWWLKELTDIYSFKAVKFETNEEVEIDEEFNSIVCDDLLDPKRDISQYRVYETTSPDHSILYKPTPEPDTK